MTLPIGEGVITLSFESGTTLSDLLAQDASGVDAFIENITSKIQQSQQELANFIDTSGLEPQELQRFTESISQATEILKVNAADVSSSFSLAQQDVGSLVGEMNDLVNLYQQTAVAASELGFSQEEAFAAIDEAVDDYKRLKQETLDAAVAYEALQENVLSFGETVTAVKTEIRDLIQPEDVSRAQVAMVGLSTEFEAATGNAEAMNAVLQEAADRINKLTQASNDEVVALNAKADAQEAARVTAGQILEQAEEEEEASLEKIHNLREQGAAYFELEAIQRNAHTTVVQLDSANNKATGEIAQSTIATEDLGNAQLRGSVTAERMRFGIINLSKGIASGRGEFALFNFVTQEVTQSMIEAGRIAQRTGATGFSSFRQSLGSLSQSFKSLAGPQAIVIAAIVVGTIAYTKWRAAVDRAKKSQLEWAKALTTAGKTARGFATDLTENLILEGKFQESFENATISVIDFRDAIAGGDEGIAVLDALAAAQERLLDAAEEARGFRSLRNSPEDLRALEDEFNANAKLTSEIERQIGSRETIAARVEQFKELLRDEIATARLSGSTHDMVRLDLIGETEARENLEASITSNSAIVDALAGKNAGLRNELERVAAAYDDTDLDGFTRRLLDLVEVSELEGITLDQVNIILGALTTQRETEARAAEQAARDKEVAQQESLEREQAELDIIEERIIARLAEGDSGLAALRALSKIEEAEDALAEAQTRKLSKGEERIDIVEAAALSLFEAIKSAIVLADDLPEGIFEQLISQAGELAEIGLIEPEVVEILSGAVERQTEAWELIDTTAQTYHDSALTDQQLLRESIAETDASLADQRLALETLEDVSIGIDIEIQTIFDDNLIRLQQGLVTLPPLTVAVRPVGPPERPQFGGDFRAEGKAHGGMLFPGQIGIVGEEGPEFAIPSRNGTLILPNSVVEHTKISRDIMNTTTEGPTSNVTVNLQGTEDDKENVVTALLLVGLDV